MPKIMLLLISHLYTLIFLIKHQYPKTAMECPTLIGVVAQALINVLWERATAILILTAPEPLFVDKTIAWLTIHPVEVTGPVLQTVVWVRALYELQ